MGTILPPFRHKRVLVVEDEAIIAMVLEDMLQSMGCVVIGPALRLDKAEQFARAEVLDAAVLDVNMSSGTSFGVAAILKDRGIPFVFSTGYGRSGVQDGFETAPVLQKPFRDDQLQKVLSEIFEVGA